MEGDTDDAEVVSGTEDAVRSTGVGDGARKVFWLKLRSRQVRVAGDVIHTGARWGRVG